MLTNIGKIITRRQINCMDIMNVDLEQVWDLLAWVWPEFVPEYPLDKLGQLKDPRIISGTLIHDLYTGQRDMWAILTEELLHSRIELAVENN